MSARQTAGRVASLLVALAACDDEQVAPLGGADKLVPLGIYRRDRPDDPLEQARDALLRDAREREARLYDAATPGDLLARSSPAESDVRQGLYSPAELFELGAQLFHYEFKREDGLGGADVPFPTRVQRGARGAAAAQSCVSCHGRGGSLGGGDTAANAYLGGDGDRPASGLARNAPSLVGLGYVELLAREMTRDLHALRERCRDAAREAAAPVERELVTKGVAFGAIVCGADGAIDTDAVVGVSADLVVRPFGWKGVFADLRSVIEDDLRAHLGLQSTAVVARYASTRAMIGEGPPLDPDGDGVTNEIREGQLSALTAYLALGEIPTEELPDTVLVPVTQWAEGRVAFEAIGCASCHLPTLTLESPTFELEPREGGAALRWDLREEGARPRPEPESNGLSVRLYSDLKRHDLGPALADTRDDRGIPARLFLTPPLWDVARTRPYLHDGSAPTLHDAIVRHGGEAESSRDAYLALGEQGQAPIRVFLTSLTRERRYVVP